MFGRRLSELLEVSSQAKCSFDTHFEQTNVSIFLYRRYEFIYFTIYCPDLRHIIKNNVNIAVAAGEKSADAWYARTTLAQAEALQCKHHVFPGHHTGHEAEHEAFAHRLLEVFKELRAQKKSE